MSIKLVSQPYFKASLAPSQGVHVASQTAAFNPATTFPSQMLVQQYEQTLVNGRLLHYGPQQPAGVPTYDASGNLVGYGPAADPKGVFFGMAANAFFTDEVYYITSQPTTTGALVTLRAGGSFSWVVPVGGITYAFTYQRKRTSTGAITGGATWSFIG